MQAFFFLYYCIMYTVSSNGESNMSISQEKERDSVSDLIRQAFIALEKEKNFSSINVSQLCARAGVSRTTFYKHYRNTAEVAEDVIEGFLDMATAIDYEILGYHMASEGCSRLPVCELIRKCPEYRPLFMDEELTGIITRQIAERNKERFIQHNSHRSLNETHVNALFSYISAGCMSFIQSTLKENDKEWSEAKRTVDSFVRAGVKSFLSAGKEKTVYFPYGDHEQAASIRTENLLDVLEPADIPENVDEDEILADALRHPYGRCLNGIVHSGEKVAILTSDSTRALPSWKILPHVLKELYAAGISPEDIVIIFAVGMHRPLSETEMRSLVGSAVYDQIRCVNADPQDVVSYGVTNRGTPVYITRKAAEADRRICLGNVEYNSMTGYSGGANALMPGAAGMETIRMNHRFMVQKSADTGIMAGNPIYEDIEEAAKMVGVDFIVNVVLNPKKQIIHASAGDLDVAHQAACRFLDRAYLRMIPKKADIVIASQGGFPRDHNLFQVGKALDNAAKAVREGGTIILVGKCEEGFGNDLFEEWMKKYHSVFEVRNAIYRNFELGAHKAVQFESICAFAEVYLVSEIDPALLNQTVLKPFASVKDALSAALKKHGSGASVIAMPYAASTFPEERAG